MNEKHKLHSMRTSESGITISPAFLAELFNEPPGMRVTIEALELLPNSDSMRITVIVSASPATSTNQETLSHTGAGFSLEAEKMWLEELRQAQKWYAGR